MEKVKKKIISKFTASYVYEFYKQYIQCSTLKSKKILSEKVEIIEQHWIISRYSVAKASHFLVKQQLFHSSSNISQSHSVLPTNPSILTFLVWEFETNEISSINIDEAKPTNVKTVTRQRCRRLYFII